MLKIDDIKKLHQKKYRQSSGYCLVEGEHLIDELYRASARYPDLLKSQLFITERATEQLSQELKSAFTIQVISEKRMAQISDTKSPQGVLAVVPLSALTATHDPSHTLSAIYLYQIQDPGNLGTIIRSLAWFGGFRLLLSPGSVDPFNSKVIRSSMGAIFHLPIECEVSLTELEQRYDHIATLDMSGAPLQTLKADQHSCFVFGNEARGVPQELLSQLPVARYTIPGSGTIESLNLATCVSLCAYQLQSSQ